MSEKNKVTLYIPSDLHRQLKVKAAVESEPMSAIAERAIVFYLSNPHVVDEIEATHGNAHRIYSCPECDSSLLFQDGDIVPMNEQPGIAEDEDELDLPSSIGEVAGVGTELHGRENLVPC